MSEAGKGFKPKSIKVSDQEYELRWDAIFAIPIDSETDKPTRNNEETQQAQNIKVDNSGKSLL